MSGTQFIQNAEIKEKYDGKYANLEPWNRKFESRLQQRNPMGMSIIKGDIKVGRKLTPVGMVYKQIAPILTTLILIARFICEIPEVTRDEWKAKGDGHQRVVEILENESYDMETKLKYLNELTKTTTIEHNSDEDSDEETSETVKTSARTPGNEFTIKTRAYRKKEAEAQARGDDEEKADLFVSRNEQIEADITKQLKSIYKSRTRTPKHKIHMTKKELQIFYKFMAIHEPEHFLQVRIEQKEATATELIEHGKIKIKDKDECEKFEQTGMLPQKVISNAIQDIDTTIQETVSARVLKEKRNINADGTQKPGLEIYKQIQTPTDNAMTNALILYEKLVKLMQAPIKNVQGYYKLVTTLRTKFNEALAQINTKMPKEDMLGLFEIIIKYPTDGEGSAERQALLSTDLTKFETSQQFYDYLGTIHISHFGSTKTKTALNNNVRTTKKGHAVKCKVPGCNGNHYANECTKTDLLAKWKTEKPEDYARYTTKPKCRFGADCRKHKEGKCKFRHDEPKANNNSIGAAINMLTYCHSTGTKPKPKTDSHKWILDNGSAKGVGCLVEYNFFHSYTTMMLIPICVSAFVYATYVIGLKRHEHHFKKRFTHAMRTHYTNHVLQFTMWVVLIIYPPLSRRSLEYFNCSSNIDGTFYLTKDYTIECFTGEWNAMLPVAIVSVAIYPLGIPALFAFQLWKHRKKLDDDAVLARYGFLYEPYQRQAFLWDIWEMLRKLLLTGVIVLIFPGKSVQVVFIALCNICFLTFILVEKPHVPGAGRTLAFLASFAITFTMMLGLVLKMSKDAQAYSGFLAFLLIAVNCTVALYTLKLILTSLCGHRCARKKGDKTVVVPSDTVAQRVKHFLAEMEKEDLELMISEDKICKFLKMSQKERDAYAARGEMQKAIMAAFVTIENKMASIESQERNTGKSSKVLRLLSSSGEKQKVEQLKTIRKEYGAQSKQYKNALTTLEK